MRRQFMTFRGSIPALVTPFRAGDGELDEVALSRLAERAADRASSGVVVCGSTGEAAAMTLDEQGRAIHAVKEAVGNRIPVIAGITAPCTQAAVAMAAAAERVGASALLCAAPPYVKPSQAGMHAHLRAVSSASGLPIILYDVPSRVGVRFDDEVIAKLYNDGIIVAIKDATADLARPSRLRRLCGPEFQQLSGDDATALAHLAMGGSGCISVTANLVPALCAGVHDAWLDNDRERALELQDWLSPLHHALFTETNPVPVKGAMGLLGLCDWTPRLPLLRVSDEGLAQLDVILRELMLMEDPLARSLVHHAHKALLDNNERSMAGRHGSSMMKMPIGATVDDIYFR